VDVAWPTLEELKSQLGINGELPFERETILSRALAASIEQVLTDTTGRLVEDLFEPSDSQAAAALLLAVRIVKAPDAPFGIAAVFDSGGLYKATNDPDYRRLLKGERSNFGVA
jgi:hypothetical protein